MGAIHFSLDLELVKALRKTQLLQAFVETGTFHGDTTAAMAASFPKVYTVELSKVIFEQTSQRLRSLPNVTMIQGESPAALKRLKSELADISVLYWLDAHWCGGVTGGDKNECPLMDELAAIGKLNANSVVLIDDARFFISPPPAPHDVTGWPMLAEVVAGLTALSKTHKLWIINDVFVFAPLAAEADVVEYGRTRGFDLNQLNTVAANASEMVRQRDATIQALQQQAGRAAVLEIDLDAGPGVPARFNAALGEGHRSEKIFAYHLKRLGVSRLLDIGSNSGQFAQKMRRFGYGGVIYSVEPQAGAHGQLLANAADDPRWLPLLRQGAGETADFVELNLSENSWSSSLLEVTPNHIGAEPTTRIVGRETIYSNRTRDLLRKDLLGGVEALKIDVQGFELKVLEGFKPFLKDIRLLLLEMSLVECYKGAPDLFSLDKFLVDKLGFSRVSLEPAYYDDSHGVVQQYDGVYYRPDHPAQAAPAPFGITAEAVITSIGGVIQRQRSDGTDVGAAWQGDCIRSWSNIAPKVVSVSENPPPAETIIWSKCATKPSIAELFRRAEESPAGHVILTNADIFLTDSLKAALPQLAPEALYYGNRHEVHVDEATAPGTMKTTGYYPRGFDVFLLPPAFVHAVNKAKLLPETFLIGEPWWDYLVPLLGFATGFPCKKLSAKTLFALHYSHEERFANELWVSNGERFLDCVRGLQKAALPHARGLLAELLEPAPSVRDHLLRITETICFTLP